MNVLGSGVRRTAGHPEYISSKNAYYRVVMKVLGIALVRDWVCSVSKWGSRADARSRDS